MRRSRGFTLIELLVVVAIIALLIAILLRRWAGRTSAKTVRCSSSLKTVVYWHHTLRIPK